MPERNLLKTNNWQKRSYAIFPMQGRKYKLWEAVFIAVSAIAY
jgi:hypothetical protein